MITQKPKGVAIVDDDESVRRALEDLLEDIDLPTLTFACAEDFLKSGERQHLACLIVDIHLPGMSGLELQSKLNAEHNSVPIIFITAHGDEKMRMQALRTGAVEFLTKPFDDEVLIDSVRAALNS